LHSSPYCLNCHESTMVAFHKLSRLARSSRKKRTKLSYCQCRETALEIPGGELSREIVRGRFGVQLSGGISRAIVYMVGFSSGNVRGEFVYRDLLTAGGSEFHKVGPKQRKVFL